MPRVNRVEKCRKSPGKCTRCSKKIKKGDPYLWWKFNFGPKYVRCSASACSPKPSELTRSEFWGRVRDLQAEGFGGENFEDLKDRTTSVIDELNSLADDCEEKFNNMPQSLQDGDTGQLLQERADALREAVSAIEAIDIPEEAPPMSESNDRKIDKDDEEAQKDYELKVDSVRDELEQALGDISCS